MVIAVGLAEYRPGRDKNVAVVYDRADMLMYDKLATLEVDGSVTWSEEELLTQPGMRYSLSKELVNVLFESPSGSIGKLTPAERKRAVDAILNASKGGILEEIALRDTKALADGDREVFKLVGRCRRADDEIRPFEVDMVVWDKGAESLALFEIKHSNAADPNQAVHLLDDDVLALIGNAFGCPIASRNVLYRGASIRIDGISYTNVADYLKTLKSDVGAYPFGFGGDDSPPPEKAKRRPRAPSRTPVSNAASVERDFAFFPPKRTQGLNATTFASRREGALLKSNLSTQAIRFSKAPCYLTVCLSHIYSVGFSVRSYDSGKALLIGGKGIKAYATKHPEANHTGIARDVGAPRPTVARWFKQFSASLSFSKPIPSE